MHVQIRFQIETKIQMQRKPIQSSSLSSADQPPHLKRISQGRYCQASRRPVQVRRPATTAFVLELAKDVSIQSRNAQAWLGNPRAPSGLQFPPKFQEGRLKLNPVSPHFTRKNKCVFIMFVLLANLPTRGHVIDFLVHLAFNLKPKNIQNSNPDATMVYTKGHREHDANRLWTWTLLEQ